MAGAPAVILTGREDRVSSDSGSLLLQYGFALGPGSRPDPPSSRKWRNWQTHQLEGLAFARTWGFESPLSHQPSLMIKCEGCLAVAPTGAEADFIARIQPPVSFG